MQGEEMSSKQRPHELAYLPLMQALRKFGMQHWLRN
jgi:hypothetical protein